jgi:soluble lytic murein transglycosylase
MCYFQRMLRPSITVFISLAALWGSAAAAPAPNTYGAADEAVLRAHAAWRKQDKAQLAATRQPTATHALAPWVAYWELNLRLAQAQQGDLDGFYAAWPGTYVEDRLRNDWLLELGRRRDWAHFRTDHARYQMNDDREVACYALLTRHLDGQDVRAQARTAWYAQRDLDDGCALMAQTLAQAQVFGASDLWHKARLAVEANRPRAARAAVALVSAAADKAMADILAKPERWLKHGQRSSALGTSALRELELLALMRMAANDPEYAAGQLEGGWGQRLPTALAATAWAHTGKQAALRQQPLAAQYALRAWNTWDSRKGSASDAADPPPWSDDLLAWQVRAALRLAAQDAQRWPLVLRATAAMSAAEQREPAWVYWRARALLAQAAPGAEGDAQRAAARQSLAGIAPQLGFYGKLATEELGGRLALPAAPAAPSAAEADAARKLPGLERALQLIALGLRPEGVREWNYTLRGLGERELLAAAQLACEREVWDRCINTSDRTRSEIDMAQRFPTPMRELVLAKARDTGLDPALLYGLIRQESRFVSSARSGVGASGLMQLMPATARWTARQVGLPYTPAMINDHEVNLHLGAAYLKRVLDDLDGSLAMATAAYNAGPGRPRRWREGATMEPAAWAEAIPFAETRDYVKKVLSNSVYYAAMLGQPVPTLKSRLGAPIGPRNPAAPPSDLDIP